MAEAAELMATKVWREVPGTDGRYSVSSCGRVRSEPGGRRRGGSIVRAAPDNRGYVRFSVRVPGGRLTLHVHSLVALLFIGPRPNGLGVNHKNGIKTDNRVENLEYVTPGENSRHASTHGLYRPSRGDRHYKAKLSAEAVAYIRASYPAKSLGELAVLFGVSKTTVCRVAKRRGWKHLT
jgi:hypothetical protein